MTRVYIKSRLAYKPIHQFGKKFIPKLLGLYASKYGNWLLLGLTFLFIHGYISFVFY